MNACNLLHLPVQCTHRLEKWRKEMFKTIAATDTEKERDVYRAAIIAFLIDGDRKVLVDAIGKKRFGYEMPKTT
jgi:hypothetical protein